MRGSCVVVVPVYTLELSLSEKAALRNGMKKLRDYDFFFLHKQSIQVADIFESLSLTPSQALSCRSGAVEDDWLCSTRSYSALLFQGWFYRLFEQWEYLLIFQQDAWVFGTGQDLAHWIDKGYTYVGAPWTGHLGLDTPDVGVGNGGFSLRHVGAMIHICESFKASHAPVFRGVELADQMTLFRDYDLIPVSQWPLIFCRRLLVFFPMLFGWHNNLVYLSKVVQTQEDHLFCLYAPLIFPWIRIPSMAEAAAFSVETNPRETCAFYQVRRPFGCHAWEKYQLDFWLSTYPEEFNSVLKADDYAPSKEVFSSPLKPLITVVMATLNAAKDLPDSLGSLAEQCSRHFEVVVVDGGSADQTCQLASRILEEARISHRIVLLPGSGIYGAINRGVREAEGEWIYVMGADDRLVSPDVFATIAPILMKAKPRTLVVHGDVWIEDPGYPYGQPWDLPRFLERNISHQSAFYRRKPIESLGIAYNENYPLYADWDYNLRLFASGEFLYVPLLVASYACKGASSQRQDEIFLADKETNAHQYLGWRSILLMPPHRFSMARGVRTTGFLSRAQFLLNRSVWALKRLALLSQPSS
jgi:glycosyltransferase involved in cell wall biosynthesis